MNYYQLFRVRSWNNSIRCLSFYILILMIYIWIIFQVRHANRYTHICKGVSFQWMYTVLLRDRPWIPPWKKSIFNEWDIIIPVIASQLSGYCDVMSKSIVASLAERNAGKWDTGTMRIDRRFIVICGFVCRLRNKNMYKLSWRTVSALTPVLNWWLFPVLLRNSGNKQPKVNYIWINLQHTHILNAISSEIILITCDISI